MFSTKLHWGIDPSISQPVLPNNLIHHISAGEEISKFFPDRNSATLECIGIKEFGLRQWFVKGPEGLERKGYRIDTRKKMLHSGYLVWRK